MTGTHRLAALSFWRRVWSLSSSPAGSRVLLVILITNFAFGFINIVLREIVGRGWAVALIATVAVLALVGLAVSAHRRNPPPVIDFDRAVLGIGSEATPFTSVDEAVIVHDARKQRDDLMLWFGGHRRRHAVVVLRGSGALGDHDREVLAAMVERSSIQLPSAKPDPYDPKGKFAWLDQQGYATKEQVLDAVLHTPTTGDIRRG